ncbi:MAG: hypothetical protein LC798_01720 [Chloroflexi bacterium]|nr:hypothetical protein [Chloroflexota bacterium]
MLGTVAAAMMPACSHDELGPAGELAAGLVDEDLVAAGRVERVALR